MGGTTQSTTYCHLGKREVVRVVSQSKCTMQIEANPGPCLAHQLQTPVPTADRSAHQPIPGQPAFAWLPAAWLPTAITRLPARMALSCLATAARRHRRRLRSAHLLTTRIDVPPVPRLVNPADVVTTGPLFLISNPTSWGWAVAGFGLLTALLRLPPSFRRQCRTPAGRLALLCPCRTRTADTVGCVPCKHRHKHKHKHKHKPEHEHEHEHSRRTRWAERQCSHRACRVLELTAKRVGSDDIDDMDMGYLGPWGYGDMGISTSASIHI
ncbi:hypothetical protein FJTKL_00353 [Diaporthe vaccinii]|uniref:Uncharacterized protein n=1 Tax=Diaporthe vaccinii TaxID=105482 RepID=A0ABR4E366_9PEZI